jgi:anti-sigma regulatory factor (Ser/Thr protein kinase)
MVNIKNTKTKVKPTKITITLPGDAYFISGVRDFTLNLIKTSTSFAEKWAFRFQSVVDELCNNAIEFGSSKDAEIRVSFIYTKDGYLEVLVEDTGTGSKKTTAAEMTELLKKRQSKDYKFDGIRGRGLAKIVSEWTDELEFIDREGGGLQVRVRKYLKDPRFKSGLPESTATHMVLKV